MDSEKLTALEERDFVASLIMSDKCCSILIPFTDTRYFEGDYTRIVIRWILEYYKQFNTAPKENILSLYRMHCSELRDDALKDLVLIFVTKIAESTETISNEDYLVDRCRDFLEFRKLSVLVTDLSDCLSLRDVKRANQLQQTYKEVSVAPTNELSLLEYDDARLVDSALHSVSEELFTLPEAISGVFGKIHREDFIAVVAGMKAGKTFCLIWLAWQAARQNKRVCFFSLEMSRDEVTQRLWTAYLGGASITVPEGEKQLTKFVPDEEYPENVRPVPFTMTTKHENQSIVERQRQMRMFAQGGDVHVVAYPAYSVTIDDIEHKVKDLISTGYIPDVVVIDYADIVKPSGGGTELRNQLDYTWKKCRAMAQELHIAVITASQTNRAGLGGHVEAENMAEDIRKLAHVTSMVAIERPPTLRKNNLCRLKNLALRSGADTEPAIFCQALSLGQFVFGRAYKQDHVILDTEDKN